MTAKSLPKSTCELSFNIANLGTVMGRLLSAELDPKRAKTVGTKCTLSFAAMPDAAYKIEEIIGRGFPYILYERASRRNNNEGILVCNGSSVLEFSSDRTGMYPVIVCSTQYDISAEQIAYQRRDLKVYFEVRDYIQGCGRLPRP